MKTLHYFILCLLLLVSTNIYAKKQTFTREYTYQASDDDSRNTSRDKASMQVRNILLKEIGELVISKSTLSTTETTQDYSEKIKSITQGIVRMKITKEIWDGKEFHITAEMTVDPDEIERKLRELETSIAKNRKRDQMKEQEEQGKLIKEQQQETQKMASDFWQYHQNNYFCLGLGTGAIYAKGIGLSFTGRHGGLIGIGYQVSTGVGTGPNGAAYWHYSGGVKLYPYKHFYLSANYGTVTLDELRSFNENERFGIEGNRIVKGFSFLPGFDYCIKNNTCISIGAGISYTEKKQVIFAWHIGIGWIL
ncbi:hypothetical protein AGMMS4956_04000 [Bacteroidia bacterium]|nr:hypothetical protein AGMMS4956_04000 [Bacteroidia bacterium]